MRVGGVERRNGFSQGEHSEGSNPMSASGMKQGRKGIGRNQGAERLRKPESAAQPGEADPVQVASPFQSAEGAPNLRRASPPISLVAPRGNQGQEAVRGGSNVPVGPKVRRGSSIFARKSTPEPPEKPQGASFTEKHEGGVSNQ